MTLGGNVCWAVIPVKAPETAKQRLAPALDAGGRQRLVSAMLRKVVAATAGAKHVDRVVLTGPGRHGLSHDITLLADAGGGLNAALTAATEAAAAQGVSRIVILPGDLPHLTPQEVDILACAPAGSIAIAPDRHGTGTNALSLPLPGALDFRFQFGADSYALHVTEAQRLGIPVETVHGAGLARDIDTPEDLAGHSWLVGELTMDTGTLDLSGKIALVTGGGGGIGRAAAICLAAHGADVAVLDIGPERCDETATRIRELGRRALSLPANVMETGQVERAVERCASELGGLDILVNNAGGVTRRPFAELSEKNWRRHIDLNLVSNLAATSAAVPLMVAAQRGGAIINVTSIEGARAAPGYAVYAACKAGINNLTRTLAVELSDHAIRVNAIAPDYTVTPGTSGNFTGPVDEATWHRPSEAQKDVIRRRIPAGRPGIDAECGHLITFLASSMASYITGTIIPVDGGTWGSGGWIRNRAGQWVLPPEADA